MSAPVRSPVRAPVRARARVGPRVIVPAVAALATLSAAPASRLTPRITTGSTARVGPTVGARRVTAPHTAASAPLPSAPLPSAPLPSAVPSPRPASTVASADLLGIVLTTCAPAVHPATLRAIIAVESGGDPLAVHINGGPRVHPRTLTDASALARAAITAGYSVDLGLMQVNSRNLAVLGTSIDAMLSPCANVHAGATLLADAYDAAMPVYGAGQPALRAALSAYNTGDFARGFGNGYVARYFAPDASAAEARLAMHFAVLSGLAGARSVDSPADGAGDRPPPGAALRPALLPRAPGFTPLDDNPYTAAPTVPGFGRPRAAFGPSPDVGTDVGTIRADARTPVPTGTVPTGTARIGTVNASAPGAIPGAPTLSIVRPSRSDSSHAATLVAANPSR